MANILIIDDDPMMCDTLSQALLEQEHHVVIAQSLTKGMEKAFSGPFDVVFLDVVLPDGNGLDACTTITLEANITKVFRDAVKKFNAGRCIFFYFFGGDRQIFCLGLS